MANYSKPYHKDNIRKDGKKIILQLYNASKGNKIIHTGKGSRKLTKDYMISVLRDNISEGLGHQDRKCADWMTEVSIAKLNNEAIKIRFIQEGELF